MKDIIANITANVLTALYQPFWFSVALSVLALFFYLFAYHNETGGRGLKAAFSVWWKYFREDLFFRKLFFLTFYTTMILFRTLLNRDMWMNPLSDVFGNWWIWKYAEDGRDLRSHFCFLCPLNFCSCSCVLELFSFQICFTILWVEALEA